MENNKEFVRENLAIRNVNEVLEWPSKKMSHFSAREVESVMAKTRLEMKAENVNADCRIAPNSVILAFEPESNNAEEKQRAPSPEFQAFAKLKQKFYPLPYGEGILASFPTPPRHSWL